MPAESLNYVVDLSATFRNLKCADHMGSPDLEQEREICLVPGIAQEARTRFVITSLADRLTVVHGITLFPGLRPLLETSKCCKNYSLITKR